MKYDFSDTIITGIFQILQVNLHSGVCTDIKDRRHCGLIIALQGHVHYEYAGNTYLSDESHALLLSQGITYSFTSETDSRSIVINFSTKEALPVQGITSVAVNLGNLAMRLENLWTFEKHAYKLRCMQQLYELFIKISPNDSLYISSKQNNLIKASIEYLETHYTDPDLTNDRLAAASGLSTVYFRKLFRNHYGMSPMHYVRQKRIEKAKKLLESQYYTSISDVAEASGFHSLFHFSKAFKQETSYSPSEYAASLK